MRGDLDAGKIAHALEELKQRIDSQFPDSDLTAVCSRLTELAGQTRLRIEAIMSPNWPLRIGVWSIIAACAAAAIYVVWSFVHVDDLAAASRAAADRSFVDLTRLFDSLMHAVTFVVAAGIFLVSIERRSKRHQTLADLHQLRSIAHVIDMHQLTKNPLLLLAEQQAQAGARPAHRRQELARYLACCSEMLSLTGKLAALYGEHMQDPSVGSAVNDVEMLTAHCSQKVWLKISVLEMGAASGLN